MFLPYTASWNIQYLGVFFSCTIIFLNKWNGFKPDKFSLKKCALQLLLPFILFNVLGFLIITSVNYALYRTLKMPDVHPLRILMGGYVLIPSWFLLSLFSIRILCYYIYKYSRLNGLLIITFVLLYTFVSNQKQPLWNVLNLGSSILGLPFFLIGFMYSNLIVKYINWGSFWGTILLFVVSCVGGNRDVDMYYHLYGNSIIAFLFFGLVGAGFLIRFSRYIHFPKEILDTFMQGALFYMCMHSFLFSYMLLIWRKLIVDDHSSQYAFTEKIVVTFLTFVVSYPIIKLMYRYTPILLGKQAKKIE